MVPHTSLEKRCTPAVRTLRRRVLLFGALIVLWARFGSAASFTAFGPQPYVRATGNPVTVRNTFTVMNPSTTYTLRIRVVRVASAVVSVNGVVIATPSDFNANVTLVEVPVALRASNELEVEVRGEPGGTLTVEVIGVDNDLPTIIATPTPGPNPNGWNNTNVTVTFTCADATSGIASCPAPVTVSGEGANQVVFGRAVDKAGNAATGGVLVSIDKTPPLLVLASPANNTTLFTSDAVIKATVSDALSGAAGLLRNYSRE